MQLASWFPGDSRACLKWFGCAGLKLKDACVSDIVAGARLLGEHGEDLVSKVVNPVLRHLTKDICGIFKEPNMGNVKPLAPFVMGLIEEMVSQKLGCDMVASRDFDNDLVQQHAQDLAKLKKFVVPY
eukprot:10026542-Karenia_brevis.AAC.1